MSKLVRPFAAAAVFGAAFLGGTAHADCVRTDVCYRNVTVYEDCIPIAGAECTPVVVEGPLCVGGRMWSAGLCRY